MSSEVEDTPKPKKVSLTPIYARSVLASASVGMATPFVGVYAVDLGATPAEMGWLSSITQLLLNLLQVPFGWLSDRVGGRVVFIIGGGVFSAALWVPMLYINSPILLIILVAVQSVLGSMATPAWAALIGDLVPIHRRGYLTSVVNTAATLGTVSTTLISGWVIDTYGRLTHNPYDIPFIAAAVLGVLSSFVMLMVHEKAKPRPMEIPKLWTSKGLKAVVAGIRDKPEFSRFCSITIIFGFFMAICWPLFNLTLVKVLNASKFEIALVSIASGLVTTLLQPIFGKMADRIGRRPLLILGRLPLFTVPLVYALATSVTQIYTYHAFLGVLSALINVAITAYLLDVIPDAEKGGNIAFYNMMFGLSTFAGSLVGGYIADALVQFVGFIIALQLTYYISAAGRLGGALLYFKLKEPKPYPTTIQKEFNLILERVRKAGEEHIIKPAKVGRKRVTKTAKKLTKRMRRKKRE